jgi:four helix bundle protein
VPNTSYRDLIAWQKAMDFVEEVYLVTRSFPREELYGLTSQLRRCSVSIPSNIAEGQGRRADGEFRHSLSIARGSLCEAETQLIIGCRLEYLDRPEMERLLAQADEVGRLITGLANSLEN